MLATVPVPRVEMCQMPRNAASSAIDTIAARKRREEVIGLSLSRRVVAGEAPRTRDSAAVVMKTVPAHATHRDARRAASLHCVRDDSE